MNNNDFVGSHAPEGENARRMLARHFAMEVIELSTVHVSQELLRTISAEIATRYGVFPVKQAQDGTLTVAVSDPLDFDAIDSLQSILKTNIKAVYSDRHALQQAIALHYGKGAA